MLHKLIDLLIYFQKLLPEIFLLFCICLLIIYKLVFKTKFSPIYSIVFLMYSVFSLSITIYLVWQTYLLNFMSNSNTDFFVINYKVSFIKISILVISNICLTLFRYCLTDSQTNCIEYFILYLFTILICLLVLNINITFLIFLFISLEFLTISFYILSSFNFNNFGYLLFRPIHKRKLLYFSSLLALLGIILFNSFLYLQNLALVNKSITLNYYILKSLEYNQHFLIVSVIFLIGSLILKMIIYHSPTHYIYYQKTPIITIVFMHIIPKIVFFYLIVELIFTNYYFIISKYYLNSVLLCMSTTCLIIGIGMRRLFLKHFMEYLSLVNSGYLLLCLSPLTVKSLNYCIYFFFYYILILLLYGGVLVFFDNIENPGQRISFDTILSEIEKKDYLTIILSNFFFIIYGMPPTRRDYPCSRGIPFNGLLLQWLVLESLLVSKFYWISYFLILFNFITFFFFIWTIIPFWYEKKDFTFSLFPRYLNLVLIEYIYIYIILTSIILQLHNNTLTLNFIKLYCI